METTWINVAAGHRQTMVSMVCSVRWNDGKALGISGSNDTSDDQLIADLAAGDHRALSRLIARHGDRLRAIALRFTGNEADADEVLQDTFWRAARKAKSWQVDGTAKFSTWLYRTMVNLCIDLNRRQRVRSWFSLSSSKVESAGLADNSPNPETVTGARQTLELVRADIANLPVRQRAALLLSVVDERSNRDIAAILEISVGAVEQALVRARRKLRDEMRNRENNEKGEG